MWSWETCGLLLKRLQAESTETSDENANLERLERVCRMTEIEDFQGPHSLPYAPLYIKDPREYFDCQQANALKSLGDSRAGIKPTDRSPSFGEPYISLAEQISAVKVKGLSDPVVQPEIALKDDAEKDEVAANAAAKKKNDSNSEEEDQNAEQKERGISNKKKKLQRRMKIAELKQICSRPDVVEVWDATAADPKLLVFLKSYRNTVPVPRHWCQKRKFLQRRAIPLVLAGADVVAMAPTGSGKTAAFLVPMLQKLCQNVPGAGVRALILLPTRDLAMQTLKFTKELGKFTDLCTSLLVGGDSMEDQFEDLAQNSDIIIATPGRLMHHLAEIDGMSLHIVLTGIQVENACWELY